MYCVPGLVLTVLIASRSEQCEASHVPSSASSTVLTTNTPPPARVVIGKAKSMVNMPASRVITSHFDHLDFIELLRFPPLINIGPTQYITPVYMGPLVLHHGDRE